MIKLEQVQLDNIITSINNRAKLASPVFTGNPTAPTAVVGTNTTQLATTAFVLANAGIASYDGGHSFTGNGYQKFTNGLIIQWATWVDNGAWTTRTFPIAFPNACLSLSHSMGVPGNDVISSSVTTISGLTATTYRVGTTGASGWTIRMMAIGY